tara:strand:+ start:8290 stop:8790 length:501 start_codon:yes stop_codon:yes gene_type:complete
MNQYLIPTIILILTLVYSSTVRAADSTVNYKNQPPPSAISPSLSIGSGSDVCVVVRSGSFTTGFLGASTGIHVIDKNCERIKLSRALAQLGLKVSATSMLCQDNRVFKAMLDAGSPCPIDGLIGKEAKAKYLELGIIDEENNIIGSRDATIIHIRARPGNYGQPTQ